MSALKTLNHSRLMRSLLALSGDWFGNMSNEPAQKAYERVTYQPLPLSSALQFMGRLAREFQKDQMNAFLDMYIDNSIKVRMGQAH